MLFAYLNSLLSPTGNEGLVIVFLLHHHKDMGMFKGSFFLCGYNYKPQMTVTTLSGPVSNEGSQPEKVCNYPDIEMSNTKNEYISNSHIL